MKFKSAFSLFLVAMFVMFSFTDMTTYAEEITPATRAENLKVNELSKVKYYDQNNNLIEPYTKEDYLKLVRAYSKYPFYQTSFTSNIWIGGGGSFYDPHYIEFERTSRPKKLAVYAYSSNGTYLQKAVLPEGTGWTETVWEHLNRGKAYKFKFVNEGTGTVSIKQGNVYYM